MKRKGWPAYFTALFYIANSSTEYRQFWVVNKNRLYRYIFEEATGHKLEESKETVIAREQNNLGRRIREALKILCHFKSLNRDRGIEPPVLHGDVLAREMVQPSSRDKTTPAIFTLADLDLLQIDLA